MQRQELARFLRSRREAADPVALGLAPGPRRRTPGLRREEVAQLSGVSVTWYTWLEQARDIGVSRQVLDRLTGALRLTGPERAHLFTLAGLALPFPAGGPPRVDETLRRLLATLEPHPAYVVNPWWDLLAYNRAHAALLGGLDHRPPGERNNLWLLFTDAATRGLFGNWSEEVLQLLGQFRLHLARFPNDPRGPELLALLRAADPKFTELWDRHDVRGYRSARKTIDHPGVGRLVLDYVKLAAADDDQQYLVVYLPADAATAERLRALA